MLASIASMYQDSRTRCTSRFIGRTGELRDCAKALNSSLSLTAVYGKRGVGKSSLMRQIQQLALGDYSLKNAGMRSQIPARPREYVTVFCTCDATIKNGVELLSRLCNDTNDEDGLLRLIPNDGKEIVEFQRSKGVELGTDLKVVSWGTHGVETSKYAKTGSGGHCSNISELHLCGDNSSSSK